MRLPFLPDEHVKYTTPGDLGMRELFVFAGGGALVVLWVAVIGAVYAKMFSSPKHPPHEAPKPYTATTPSATTNVVEEERRKSRSNSLLQNVNPYSPVRYE